MAIFENELIIFIFNHHVYSTHVYFDVNKHDLSYSLIIMCGGNQYWLCRYPDDPYDLLWRPFDDINWSTFNTSFGVTNPNVAFQPPSKVMMTAVRPAAESDALYYNWAVDDLSLELQVYMHFAELEQLGANERR